MPSSPYEQDEEELSKLRQAIRSATDKLLDVELAKLKIAVATGDTQTVIMSMSMLLALTICPAMLSSQEAIRQSQSKTRREEHRGRRCNLVVSCLKRSTRARDIDNRVVVLRDSKLYVSSDYPPEHDDILDQPSSDGYPFSGYFLPYPDAKYEGLVSTISDVPPQLNWIYIDKDTYEVKYGLRVDAQHHITGPFDCTKQDRRLTLQGWEGYVAVEETPGIWALYFDMDDDGLRKKVGPGRRVLEIELARREKKVPKPEPGENAPTTLDEKMKQHQEQSNQADPVDKNFLNPTTSAAEDPPVVLPQIDDAETEKALGLAEALLGLQLKNQPMSRIAEDGDKSLGSDHNNDTETDVNTTALMQAAVKEESTKDQFIVGTSVEQTENMKGDGSVYKKPTVEEEV